MSYANQIEVVETKDVNLWTETFGNAKDKPILLIIGAETQGIMWPYEFCMQLAKQGFFVIRYDYRDTGLSSSVDYNDKPYTIMDLAKDAIAILDHYKIKSAHIVGASMGGTVAQFIGAYFPEYAISLTFIMTSPDLEGVLNAIEGKLFQGGLSIPSPDYIKWANDCFGPSSKTPVTMAEKLNAFMEDWRICNGKDVPFPEELNYQLGLQSIARGKGQTSAGNHINAIKASYKEHREALSRINQPTLIIHGRQDPVLGIDHAESLNKIIFGSKLFLIDKMGHTINPQHYPQIIELIVRHIKDLTFA